MVDIVRRKNVEITPERAYQGDVYKYKAMEKIGSVISTAGDKIEEKIQKDYKEKLSKLEKQQKAEKKAYDTQKKAYDASDRLIATDRAGQLKNDLLRWNMEKRQSNPTYIGSREHESDMRAEYSRLAEMYGKGLGEVGTAEFNTKTQGYVNQFAENDIKWAYQQKLKQGEESAKNIALNMNQTAGVYGANGDIQGFKESYSENREKLSDYATKSNMIGMPQALYEVDKKSMIGFYDGLAKTNPKLAKALLENIESFKQTVPDEMIENVNAMAFSKENKDLNEQLILVNAGLENTTDKKERKVLEKQKDSLEKQIKDVQKKDYSEDSINAIYNEFRKSMLPQIKKQYELNELAQKQAQEQAVKDTYVAAINPDINISGNARATLKMQQPSVEKMLDKSTTDADMHKAYKDYIKADQEVIQNEQPTLQGTVDAIELINNLIQPSNQSNIKQVENALKTTTELHNCPITQEQYNQGSNIIYNAMSNPEYKQRLQNTMALAKANILDHYAELFSSELAETDKEFQKPEHTTPIASGIMVDFKTKKVVDFNYSAASDKNKAKYNLVKDTYAGVLNDVSSGNFELANDKIFELPYNIAYINYEGKLSPDIIKKFIEQDKTGGKPTEFLYNGYYFEYLGIDQTGTIKAKRRL